MLGTSHTALLTSGMFMERRLRLLLTKPDVLTQQIPKSANGNDPKPFLTISNPLPAYDSYD